MQQPGEELYGFFGMNCVGQETHHLHSAFCFPAVPPRPARGEGRLDLIWRNGPTQRRTPSRGGKAERRCGSALTGAHDFAEIGGRVCLLGIRLNEGRWTHQPLTHGALMSVIMHPLPPRTASPWVSPCSPGLKHATSRTSKIGFPPRQRGPVRPHYSCRKHQQLPPCRPPLSHRPRVVVPRTSSLPSLWFSPSAAPA